jgi:hypothetical protein
MTDVAQMQISPAMILFIKFPSVNDSAPLRMPLPLAVIDWDEPATFVLLDEKAFELLFGASPPGPFRSPRGGNAESVNEQRNQNDDRNRNAQKEQQN